MTHDTSSRYRGRHRHHQGSDRQQDRLIVRQVSSGAFVRLGARGGQWREHGWSRCWPLQPLCGIPLVHRVVMELIKDKEGTHRMDILSHLVVMGLMESQALRPFPHRGNPAHAVLSLYMIPSVLSAVFCLRGRPGLSYFRNPNTTSRTTLELTLNFQAIDL